jgi:hypothetical protein
MAEAEGLDPSPTCPLPLLPLSDIDSEHRFLVAQVLEFLSTFRTVIGLSVDGVQTLRDHLHTMIRAHDEPSRAAAPLRAAVCKMLKVWASSPSDHHMIGSCIRHGRLVVHKTATCTIATLSYSRLNPRLEPRLQPFAQFISSCSWWWKIF